MKGLDRNTEGIGDEEGLNIEGLSKNMVMRSGDRGIKEGLSIKVLDCNTECVEDGEGLSIKGVGKNNILRSRDRMGFVQE